jgi:hypothetical protein
MQNGGASAVLVEAGTSLIIIIDSFESKGLSLRNLKTISIKHRNFKGSGADLLQKSHLDQGLDRCANFCIRNPKQGGERGFIMLGFTASEAINNWRKIRRLRKERVLDPLLAQSAMRSAN